MPLQTRELSPATDGRTSPSHVDQTAWIRASRALVTQLKDPQDPTALRRRLTEVHRNSTRGFDAPPTDPAAIDAADLYGRLTEI